jgi:hypothetical protein
VPQWSRYVSSVAPIISHSLIAQHRMSVSLTTCNCNDNAYIAVLYFATPLSKLCLLILSLDRLYAILRPLAYRIRNHTRFAIIASIIAYVIALLCFVYALLNANTSTTIIEHCVHTNVITPSAVLNIAGIILLFDMVTYITSIVLVFLVRYKISEHTATVASNAAAKQDAMRQVLRGEIFK